MKLCHQCGATTKDDARFCRSCGAPLINESGAPTDPLVGRTVGGSYLLQGIVGVGGMGRVYKAEQSTLGRTVAIKVIHPHLLSDEQTVARFYTEAKASSRLNHPNSVSIIDFGRTDDGILFLAMEFLGGRDLAHFIHEDGPLPFLRICDILIDVLSALAEAHASDVVHRDLKPENIILRRMGSGRDLVKVVDFGLATIVDNQSTSITRPGLVCGTPDYIAPEQARGDAVDARGDLYSLGVVLYELLADRLPFEDDTPTKVVLRHLSDPVPDPREVAPHRFIPDALAEICIKALQKKREARFQSAEEMADAIRQVRSALETKSEAVECPSCGASNPPKMRFCGSCGARIGQKRTVSTPAVPLRATFRPAADESRPVVGRVRALDTFVEACSDPSTRTIAVTGEAGIGKTRFLREAARLIAGQGFEVIGALPNSLGAAVPFGAVRRLIESLMLNRELNLEEVIARPVFSNRVIQAGLKELEQATGIVGGVASSKALAVARLLRTLFDEVATNRLAIFMDDFELWDSLSVQVVNALKLDEGLDAVFVTASSRSRAAEHVIELDSLSREEAKAFLKKLPVADDAVSDGPRYLPLFLEQLERLGIDSLGDSAMPTSLADAVMHRVDALQVEPRRLLQALAVLGGFAPIDKLHALTSPEEQQGLTALVDEELVEFSDLGASIVHPFIARIVEGSIPAEARKELHRLAKRVTKDAGEPLDIVAEHAYRGGASMPTLMTLERAGNEAGTRGDLEAQVRYYQRALLLARQEVLDSGDPVMDTAIVTFSKKLAIALMQSGHVARADGVVREVMDLAGPKSNARAEMCVIVGRISQRRGRRRDAMRNFGIALEIVAGENPRIERDLQHAIGELRMEDGDPSGAANAFRRAIELANEIVDDDALEVWLSLVKALVEQRFLEPARKALSEAKRLAESAGHEAILAQLFALQAQIESEQNPMLALTALDEAKAASERVGDVLAVERWREVAANLM